MNPPRLFYQSRYTEPLWGYNDTHLVIRDHDGKDLACWPKLYPSRGGWYEPSMVNEVNAMQRRADRLCDMLNRPGRDREQALRELGVRK